MGKYVLKDLDVYNLSIEIADEIWKTAGQWDIISKDTVGKQLVRSADSIAANIAEGMDDIFIRRISSFAFTPAARSLKPKRGSLKQKTGR